jgi:hypothetical protein
MPHALCPKVKPQIPPLRFGRDDKVEGGAAPWQWWRRMGGADEQWFPHLRDHFIANLDRSG